MREGFSRLFVAATLLMASLAFQFPALGQVNPQSPSTSEAGTQEAQSAAIADGQLRPIPENEVNQSTQTEITSPPTQPKWFPLPADQAEHISQLLDYWQKSSDQIKQCTCEFTRWDYDPTYCNYRSTDSQELAAFAVWRGEIRFASPDKAMFETNELWKFTMENDKPDMAKSADQTLKLKWICDGSYIYEYNFINKVLTDIEIPAKFQGEGMVNSPLPFLFGANRETLLNRFWIRPITPASATEEYWLEAIPKRLEDARTYSRVEIVISQQDFLPKSMVLFAPNYDPKTNPISQAYVFENRKINGTLAAVQDFLRVFIKPSTPIGWTRAEQKPFADDSVTAQKEEIERAKR